MEVDNSKEDDGEGNEPEGNDEEPNEEAAEDVVKKNKEEFWSDEGSTVGSEQSDRRSRTEPKMHRTRPRREKTKKKPVQRGRVTKRGTEASKSIRVSKRGAPAKRKTKPLPKPVKVVSVSSLISSGSSGSYCSRCREHVHKRRSVLSRRSRKDLVAEIVRKIRRCGYSRRRRRQALPLTEHSAVTQAGSASKFLSPLLVKANEVAQLRSEPPLELGPSASEVTPEMIVESLRHVTMWRQSVPVEVVLDYMKKNYPVNPDYEALMAEVSTKLTIAATVGFIEKCYVKGIDHWCLNSGFQKRKLMKNHVDLFWKLYVDTLSPAMPIMSPKAIFNVFDIAPNTDAHHNEADDTDKDDQFRII